MVAENRKKSVEVLNKAVAMELTAVHQYMYFHFHCEDMGYKLLADLFHKTSILEMRHVEKFAEHILFLKGDVKMKMDKNVECITDVQKMLEYSTALEHDTVEAYNRFAAECAENRDAASKKIIENILMEEEEHEDIFDTEAGNLKQFGEKLLALQALEYSREMAEK